MTAQRGSGKTVGGRFNKRKPLRVTEQVEYPCVVRNGKTTHVLVPIEEYERVLLAGMAAAAVRQIESSSDEDDCVDADQIRIELAAERIARARKGARLTQTQLGRKLGIPQSQISRIERNPDHTTIRTLRRIAKALKVDVHALL